MNRLGRNIISMIKFNSKEFSSIFLLREKKLKEFKYLLKNNRSSNSLVHLELASIGDRLLMKSILENVNFLGLFILKILIFKETLKYFFYGKRGENKN